MLIVDPAGGLSGDMFLGGLFALGVNPGDVEKAVSSLPGLEPFKIVFGRVKRKGISAVRARVVCGESVKSRNLKKILLMIRRSGLDPEIREMASKTFRILGEAEGKIHGVPTEKVHFHEVGAVDSIVDIVGAAAALFMLGCPALYHRPFRLGCGIMSMSHGKLPLPAPATLELLAGRTVTMTGDEEEMVTPTGAALMKALARELPLSLSFVPGRAVYSVGTRETGPGPGMLRMVEASGVAGDSTVVVIKTAVDDMNPEIFGYLQEKLFDSGALDVYMTPVLMKKNRPGTLLTVLCGIASKDDLVSLIFRETTTFGIRISIEERTELERWIERVDTPYGKISIKCGRLQGGEIKASPEYESCRKRAIQADEPVSRVYDAARTAAGSAEPARKRFKNKSAGRKGPE